MGWTWYHASNYKRGEIDRLAECTDILTSIDEENGSWIPLKIRMVGTTAYAAVKRIKPSGEEYIFAAVVLTSTNVKEHYNFGYKDMDETCGPAEAKCPISILSMLSPTENEYALDWRKRCEEYAREKAKKSKNPLALNKLPVGTRIAIVFNGEKRIVSKVWLTTLFKRPVWIDLNQPLRFPTKILENCGYEVVSTPAITK